MKMDNVTNLKYIKKKIVLFILCTHVHLFYFQFGRENVDIILLRKY